MAKKTHLKVRMVPESNPDSKFIYYAKKPTKGEKAKDKLKLKTGLTIKKKLFGKICNITFLNTGLTSMTGGRVKKIEKLP